MAGYDLALALGGGGVRCMMHVGILDVLSREGIIPDLVVGSSIGSVIGGVYAYRPDAEFLKRFALRFSGGVMPRKIESFLSTDPKSLASKLRSFISFSVAFVHSYWDQGMISPDMVKRAYRNVAGRGVLERRKFLVEDTEIRLGILTTDIISGDAVVITTGDMPDAMYASSAMPGVCKPLNLKGMLLMDGGIISLLPVMAAHIMGAKRVIALDSVARIKGLVYNNSIEMLDKASEIRGYRWNLVERSLADMVISADEVRDFEWFQFSKAATCIEAGSSRTEAMLDEVKALLDSPGDSELMKKRSEMEKFYPYRII